MIRHTRRLPDEDAGSATAPGTRRMETHPAAAPAPTIALGLDTDAPRQPPPGSPATAPLVLQPRPSVRLGTWVLGSHLAALGTTLALPLDWFWRLGLGVVLLASLGFTLWARVLGRAPWSIHTAVWGDSGWVLLRNDRRVLTARLAPSSFIGLHLVVLNLRCEGLRRATLVLSADAIDADLLRRLRVRLRLTGQKAHRAAG